MTGIVLNVSRTVKGIWVAHTCRMESVGGRSSHQRLLHPVNTFSEVFTIQEWLK